MAWIFLVTSLIDFNLWAAGQLQQERTPEKQTTFRHLGTVNNVIKKISCGWDFLAILTSAGQVHFIGRNSPGFRLEDGSNPHWIDKISPIPLNTLKFATIAAGLRHIVAVSDMDRVFEFKGGKTRELFPGDSLKVVGCSAGAHHSVIWTDDGHVGVWGDNRFGQAGQSKDEKTERPKKVDDIRWISSDVFNNERIVDVQSGWSHILLLTESGKVFSWGRSDFGQLGRPITKPDLFPAPSAWPQKGLIFDPTPHLVSLSTAFPIRSISVGAEHCLALTEDGQLWTWGWNEHGSCGVAPDTSENSSWSVPIPRLVVVGGGDGVVRLAAAGYSHSMALLDA
ncbi:hypothetical protein Aperf_G00000002263 [Anoplocephala perfoliata]